MICPRGLTKAALTYISDVYPEVWSRGLALSACFQASVSSVGSSLPCEQQLFLKVGEWMTKRQRWQDDKCYWALYYKKGHFLTTVATLKISEVRTWRPSNWALCRGA